MLEWALSCLNIFLLLSSNPFFVCVCLRCHTSLGLFHFQFYRAITLFRSVCTVPCKRENVCAWSIHHYRRLAKRFEYQYIVWYIEFKHTHTHTLVSSVCSLSVCSAWLTDSRSVRLLFSPPHRHTHQAIRSYPLPLWIERKKLFLP